MRIAALVALAFAAAAAAAPANACIIEGPTVSYFLQEPPADLAPNELVLEVRFVSRELYKVPPLFGLSDRVLTQGSVTDRLSVVRVVHGKFDGDVILIPMTGGCGGVATRPLGGAETGLVAGFATPPAPDWNDAPALKARTRSYSWGKVVSRYDLDDLKAPPLPPEDANDPAALIQQASLTQDLYARRDLFEHAVAILRARADSGDTSAMIAIGGAMRQRMPFMLTGFGSYTRVPLPDPAIAWFERAAALGDTKAMFLLGRSYDSRASDQKLPELRTTATEWYLKAAEAGHACAMGTMAQRYRNGWGATENKDQALAWYRKATAAGVIMSAYGYEIEGPRPKDDVPQLSCPGT